jgi:hypothetical protein
MTRDKDCVLVTFFFISAIIGGPWYTQFTISRDKSTSCTGRNSENICSSSNGGAWETKLSLPPKSVLKLVCVSFTSLCKIFILSYTFDALLC